MICRAMQALYKLALAPVAETIGDRNAYGFREGRGCADAIAAAFNALSKPNSPTWVLEADFKGCYDHISQDWMLKNIPMDKAVLKKWLPSGYVEDGKLYPSRKGTPQGGIISPTLANLTLDGLEKVVHDALHITPAKTVKSRNKKGSCSYQVIRLSSIGIKRHIKIKADANPYDPEYAFYFRRRRNQKESWLLPSLSAREYCQAKLLEDKTAGASHKVVLLNA